MHKKVILFSLLFSLGLGFFGCGAKPARLSSQPSGSRSDVSSGSDSNFVSGGLMCAADSEEQAQEIAEQYGITLKSYGNGVAEFTTEEDPMAVIARGQKNKWTPLSRIGVTHITEGD